MARRTPYPFPEGARAGKGQLAFDQLTCEPSNMEVREHSPFVQPLGCCDSKSRASASSLPAQPAL